MANNYVRFSEQIEGIPPEGIKWARRVLQTKPDDSTCDVDDDEEEIYEQRLSALKDTLGLEGEVDLEYWPEFSWEISDDMGGKTDPPTGGIWLYSEEGCNFEHLQFFVQALISKYMPDYIFTLTSADTCSKPRLGEFGGGWMAITKDDIEGGHTYDYAETYARRLRAIRGDIKGRVRPIEMYCCYDDNTWQCEHFVEIPESTFERDIKEVALAMAKKQFTEESIVFIGVYSIPDDWSDWPQESEAEEDGRAETDVDDGDGGSEGDG
jgi:hypothetical protein